MIDRLTCEGVLLARTVPEETRDGEITVCSVWWIPALGGLTRIYPLDLKGREHAFRTYRLELTKSAKDPRYRSFKLADGASPVPVGTPSMRDRLREPLEHLATDATITRLNNQRDSLGVIRPLSLKGVYEQGAPDVTKRWGRRTFGLRPRICFEDAAGTHALGLNEWGCYEWLRKGGDPEQLWQNLRLGYADREELLLVGNIRDHPTSWVVISVLGYGAHQASLFSHVPDPLKESIFERDEYRCQNPSCTNPQESLTIDHVIPLSRGGDSSESNLRTLCLACNREKNDRLDGEWM